MLTLDPLYTVMGWLLALYYEPFHSLGLAVILLTFTVMLVQFPLIAKQTRSMIQMQRVQPEIKRIQQKYKDDKAKQNEELMKFYQENKINPLAGCLPLIIIFPIGIAVYRLFREGVERHIPTTGSLNSLYTALCSKAPSKHTPPSVHDCANYLKDHQPRALYFLGMNLNWSARQVQTELSGHVVQWIPYFALIVVVMLTGWYQVRQTQARQLRQGGAPINAQMQMITRVMPVFFGFITYTLNAATTLYFVCSNLWRIGQQHLVLNKMYDEAVAAGEIKPTDKRGDEGKRAALEDESSGAAAGNGKAGGKPSNGKGQPNATRRPNAGKATGSASGSNGNANRGAPNPSTARRKKKRKR